MAGATRDVTESDTAGLAVPQEATDDEKDKRAEDDGKSNDESLALGELLVRLLGEVLVLQVEEQGRGLGLFERVVAVAVEREGDVTRHLHVLRLGVEWPVAPGGGDGGFGEFLVLLPLLAGGVEDVEAGGDHEGGVAIGLGLVEEVRVPSDYGSIVSN